MEQRRSCVTYRWSGYTRPNKPVLRRLLYPVYTASGPLRIRGYNDFHYKRVLALDRRIFSIAATRLGTDASCRPAPKALLLGSQHSIATLATSCVPNKPGLGSIPPCHRPRVYCPGHQCERPKYFNSSYRRHIPFWQCHGCRISRPSSQIAGEQANIKGPQLPPGPSIQQNIFTLESTKPTTQSRHTQNLLHLPQPQHHPSQQTK